MQADILAGLGTHAVVPLVPEGTFKSPLTGLNPVFDVNGARLMMLTQAIVAVSARDLKRPIASLAGRNDEVIRALDILLLGF